MIKRNSNTRHCHSRHSSVPAKARQGSSHGSDEPATQYTLTVAVVWYREQDYQRLMEMFPDRCRLPKTFADWQVQAGKMSDLLRKEGMTPVKAYIDPDHFARWCEERGLAMDYHARTQFAAEFGLNAPHSPVSLDPRPSVCIRGPISRPCAIMASTCPNPNPTTGLP
jgi:hypothetical protein